MGELAENTVPAAQMGLVVQSSAVELQSLQSRRHITCFALKYLSKGLQCGSEVVLSSVGLIQVFRITCDITCRECLLKYEIPNHKYNTSVWTDLSRQGSL